VAVAPGIGEAGAAPVVRAIDVRRLGHVEYGAALELQARMVEERKRGEIGDSLLLLEHPPVITLGVKTKGKSTNIVVSPEALAAEGVAVFETGRGGDITYHGPASSSAIPSSICARSLRRASLRARSRRGADAGHREFGIEGRRVKADGVSGWERPARRKNCGDRRADQPWITSHGFALNVATDLRHFRLIVPCGIADRGVTSNRTRARLAGPMRDVEDAVVRALRCGV
jgi:lipoyl(octanoyl) transferase